MHLFRSIAVAVVGLLSIACVDRVLAPVGAPPRGVFTTDSLGYSARAVADFHGHAIYEFRIVARYENTTAFPISTLKCTRDGQAPLYGVVVVGNASESAYGTGRACSGTFDNLLVIAAGSTRVDTLTVRGPNLFDAANEPRGTTEGKFKLFLLGTWDCPGAGSCAMPDSLYESNEFVVRVGR